MQGNLIDEAETESLFHEIRTKFITLHLVGCGDSVKSKIVNNCARGLYTHFMFRFYAFGSRTERSVERLPKAAGGSIKP